MVSFCYTWHMTKSNNDVNFLFEMGTIRYNIRMWRRFLSPNFANLAEHHFRVFWVAMIIAAREKNVDTGKIAKMVLVHDISESRSGDVDYLSRQYVERNEDLGIKDILDGTSVEEEFLALREEYEKRQSLEAKIVKDADNLDIDIELAEQAAMGNESIGKSIGSIRIEKVRPRLYTETAKKLFDEIIQANPHEWHAKSRNRSNSGDWKEKV